MRHDKVVKLLTVILSKKENPNKLDKALSMGTSSEISQSLCH